MRKDFNIQRAGYQWRPLRKALWRYAAEMVSRLIFGVEEPLRIILVRYVYKKESFVKGGYFEHLAVEEHVVVSFWSDNSVTTTSSKRTFLLSDMNYQLGADLAFMPQTKHFAAAHRMAKGRARPEDAETLSELLAA